MSALSAMEHADVIIIGAGAAGLMAGIRAGRTDADRRIVVLDGARTLGAKILVAGGGRCNVTHHHVDERAFAGSSRHAIKQVLRHFDVPCTIEFFRELGVELKQEETGKLFPVTDSAKTVLNALLDAARAVGVEIIHPCRVETIRKEDGAFIVGGERGDLRGPHVILATGGRSLPKTGSDGHGYALVRSLGHSITDRVFPALVPLKLPEGHFVRSLSGLSTDATVEVRSATGKRLVSFTNAVLCTHFGLSGPGILDASRHYTNAKLDDPGATLVINWLPGETAATIDRRLRDLGPGTPLRFLHGRLPERLARALCGHADVDPTAPGHALTRQKRRDLAAAFAELAVPVSADRGWQHAEVTAGGVPLREVHLATMASRVCPGLHLCGEICDVDGRIGGFNFQWAWASGHTAGTAVGRTDEAGKLRRSDPIPE